MKWLPNKKQILLALDALLIPGLFLCEMLTDFMLSRPSECPWVRLGGQCAACGGTHFVNSLLNGKVAEAFSYNPFLFVLLVLAVLALILMHLSWFAGWKWAGRLLKGFYSVPMVIGLVAFMLVFFFARNIPVFLRILELLSK